MPYPDVKMVLRKKDNIKNLHLKDFAPFAFYRDGMSLRSLREILFRKIFFGIKLITGIIQLSLTCIYFFK